jgi:hypothetical protein
LFGLTPGSMKSQTHHVTGSSQSMFQAVRDLTGHVHMIGTTFRRSIEVEERGSGARL